jgi:hypothetical protein
MSLDDLTRAAVVPSAAVWDYEAEHSFTRRPPSMPCRPCSRMPASSFIEDVDVKLRNSEKLAPNAGRA